MIAENKILQKSLLVLLILILPSSIYTFTSVTAQGGNGSTQGGTQGFAGGNTTNATLNPNYTSATPIIK